MVYYHLTAVVQGSIKDVLVSDEEKDAPEFEASDYFDVSALNVEIKGAIEIFPVDGDTGLPDVIG